MIEAPNLFALPPGVDFPDELVTGLLDRFGTSAPEDMARVTLILNTQRMRERVKAQFQARGARFLPRLLLVTEVDRLTALPPPPPAQPLRRRLELAQLLDGLLQTGITDFPRAALFDLAESLASLMEEMQGEGVTPDRIAALDVAEHSGHWARTQAFLGIVAEALKGDAPDAEGRLRRLVLDLTETWATAPPKGPVIVAGSTGSRGTTALLMLAVARLPQGAVVLPGFDFDLPDQVWDSMDDALTAEDHPQYRFRRLMEGLGIGRGAVQPWTTVPAPSADRNKLLSLALRPAPITDQWLDEGPNLPDLGPATEGLTLIEAPGERAEALAIALILREAAETGTPAALITPDRNLTRRVTAALDRWGIRPDDSAGKPLALSAPGRLLRQVAGLFGQRLTVDAALAVIKHPLAFTGEGAEFGRGQHLILSHEYELHLRRHGPVFPTAESLADWAAKSRLAGATRWAAILGQTLCGQEAMADQPLTGFLSRHLALTEALARGFAETGSGALWEKEAGIKAREAVQGLQDVADAGGVMSPGDYASLFRSILDKGEVREAEALHPAIMIRGTLEARVQGADLVILGGLNDGIWPAAPPPDPWLNRAMRKAAGLLLPERKIGLSAHDFQQGIAAPSVVLSRSIRGAEAQTVPSRWVNRLVNLMEGLPGRGGPDALKTMRDRGKHWLTMAEAYAAPKAQVAAAIRPSPRPPVAVRPRQLSITEIQKLIRDPYAIYAKHILKLAPLDPLRPEADPRLRGTVLHKILETYLREGEGGEAALMSIADRVLEAEVAWPLARAIWRARIEKAAPGFLAFSADTGGKPVLVEERGAVTLQGQDFTLKGKPDRIDMLDDGRLLIIDYKTGAPPSAEQQKHFDRQLYLAAAMAENGAFAGLPLAEVAKLAYVGVKADFKVSPVDLEPGEVARVWAEFKDLIAAYARPSRGYSARAAMAKDSDVSDYDHLSRYGEWDETAAVTPEDLA